MKRYRTGGMALLVSALCACGGDEAHDAGAAEGTAAAPVPASPVTARADSASPSGKVAGDPLDVAGWVLRADGIGPVRVGMTVAEADRAAGGLDRTTGLEPCDYVRPRNGLEQVAFMVEDGRITRVDVLDSARVMTVAGIRPGESETAARQAYPNARVQPHKYEDGHYLVVIPGAPADTLHRLVFETNGAIVTRMRGGLYPAVEYVEGCS